MPLRVWKKAAATDTAEKHTHRREPSAFSSVSFRFYFGASCFSTFATWITRFLLGWTTWDLTHSALWVGIVSAAMLLPTFLLSPIFGVISDRISARNGMLVTTSLQAVLGATAAFVAMQNLLSVGWLLILSSCIGAVSAAHHPMRLALIPKLVRREQIASAIGISAVVFNSSRIIGPAIGAWLIAHASITIAFMTAAALFTGALVALSAIAPIAPTRPETRASLLKDLRAGLSFIAGHPGILLILALTMINGLFGRTVIELLPAISGRLINGDASSLAVLTAFAGAGSIVGGVVIAQQRGSERRILNLVLFAMLCGALALLPVIFIFALPGLSAVVLLLSMTMTMIGTGCQALIQLMVANAFRGRVLSIWTVVSMGVPAFGAFIMGATADLVGFRPVLVTFAVATIVATGLAFAMRSIAGLADR